MENVLGEDQLLHAKKKLVEIVRLVALCSWKQADEKSFLELR